MSSQIKKFTLAAAAVLTLGYLVGCGTRGENTGFGDKKTGLAVGLGSGSSSSSTTTTTGGLTGGSSGTATVNDAFPLTAATGLTISPMFSTSGGTGNSNPPTRLAFGNFGGTLGTRVVCVQGFGVATGGRVILMPRNPEATAGTSNLVLNPTRAGSDAAAVQALTNPFGLLVENDTIFITDLSTSAANGRLMVYDQVQADGTCRGRQILTTPPLSNPVKIVKDGNVLYVAENSPRGAGGRIRRIDLTKPFTDPTNSFIVIDNVNNPTGLALDKFNGRNLLYIAENGATSASGATGGIAVVNMTVSPFNATSVPTPLGTLTTTAGGATASPGVYFVTTPVTPPTPFNFPFDIAVDNAGNVVTTEGVSAATNLINPTFQTGRIRVIRGTATGGLPATAATTVLQNAAPGSSIAIQASRGVNLKNEDGTGTVISAFFTEGVGLTTTLRQLTFRSTDGAIFRHIQLDSGKIAPLDTLFDVGDTASTPPIAPNVKYTVGSFNGGTQGQVFDVR